jgi:NADH-quinone oxidoreductase subunit N
MNALQQLISLQEDLHYFFPELILCFWLFSTIVLGLFLKDKSQSFIPFYILIGLIFSLIADFDQFKSLKVGYLFNDMLFLNQRNVIFKFIFESCGIITLFFCLTSQQTQKLKNNFSELFSLILFVILGSHLLLMSANFLMLFLSLEMVSIGSYILVIIKSDKKTSEATLKYILMGMVASGIMVYGISFLFGFTGTLDFTSQNFHQKLGLIQPAPVLMAFILLFAGVIFKISAVPFHFWSPDVYEASLTPIVAFFSSVTKAAGVGFMLNVIPILWNYDFITDTTGLHDEVLIGSLALITITIGTLVALMQQNAKRLLAYAAIAHSGFLILPLISNNKANESIVIYYLIVYILASFIIFIGIDILEEKTGSQKIQSFDGIGKNNVLFTLILLFSLISFTGLPPTSGFLAKLFVFTEIWKHYTLKEHFFTLFILIVGLLATVISLFFYLKIPYHLIFKQNNNHLKISFTWKVYTLLLVLTFMLILTFTHVNLFVFKYQ